MSETGNAAVRGAVAGAAGIHVGGTIIPRPATLIQSMMTIKADPTALNDKATAIETQLSRLRQHIDTLNRSVWRTEGYWLGKAAELHRKAHTDMIPIAEEMLGAIESHVQNLREVSGVYRTAEAGIESRNTALPDDAIE